MRFCEVCEKPFIVKPETLRSEKKLHIKVRVCDKCQRKDYARKDIKDGE